MKRLIKLDLSRCLRFIDQTLKARCVYLHLETMRFPNNISKNTKAVYHSEGRSLLQEKKGGRSSSVDVDWDVGQPKRLKELCIEIIASNWIGNPLVNEIALLSDICALLDLLPTTLPVELTASKIAYDVYWLRCYKDRWPQAPPLGKNFSEIEQLWPDKKQVGASEVSASSSSFSSSKTQSADETEDDGQVSKSTGSQKSSATFASERFLSRKTLRENREHRKTWKQHYLEAHLTEILENLEPVDYNPEEIKRLSILCRDYVTTLYLRQLRSPTTSDVPDHIPLNATLSGLPLLTELSICYKQAYVGEKFSWHIFNTTMSDVVNLAKGLEQTRLKVLRIQNSDINCVKVKMLLKALLRNDRLRTLDFSHCKISEHGTAAICRFLQEHRKLENLILSNNYIGPDAARCLAYVLSENCSLVHLDLRLNMINSVGGRYLHAALERGAKNLRSLVTAACGLTGENVEIGSALRLNAALENLDVSNNRVGEEVGKAILDGLRGNRTLLSIDVRRCCITPQTDYEIRQRVLKNRGVSSRQRRVSLAQVDFERDWGGAKEELFPEALISEINDITFD